METDNQDGFKNGARKWNEACLNEIMYDKKQLQILGLMAKH
jgi:hypothetical protein